MRGSAEKGPSRTWSGLGSGLGSGLELGLGLGLGLGRTLIGRLVVTMASPESASCAAFKWLAVRGRG